MTAEMITLVIFLLLILAAVLLFAILFWAGFVYNLVWSNTPFLRSSRKKIETMLELAQIKTGETVIDLGSGDGTLLLKAAEMGAKAIGVEINPFLVWYSKVRIGLNGFSNMITVAHGDFYNYPLGNADVIFIYLLPEALIKLKDQLSSECKPDVRIVVNTFLIPGWVPEKEKDSVYLCRKPYAFKP